MSCGTATAIREFVPSYQRASVMQASLAIVGATCGIIAGSQQQDGVLIVAALLIGAVVPFTLVIIAPTDKQLVAPSLDRQGPLAAALLRRWAAVHAVWSILTRSRSPCLSYGSRSVDRASVTAKTMDFDDFSQERVTVSAGSISVRRAGSGPPVWLLHGFPEISLSWRKVAPELANAFTVIAADLPGYGESTLVEDAIDEGRISKRTMARALVDAMTELEFPQLASLATIAPPGWHIGWHWIIPTGSALLQCWT